MGNSESQPQILDATLLHELIEQRKAMLPTSAPIAPGSWLDNGVEKYTQGTPPSITHQPVDASVDIGETATFTVAANNATSLQWQLDSGAGYSDVSGATSVSYTTAATVAGDDGNQYRCVVTGPGGVVNSNTVTLNVVVPDYYVDPTGGSDANAGTTEGAAWQTLAKLQTESASFAAGTVVALKSGETFVTSSAGFKPTCVGASGNEILFTTYGGTAKALIDGSAATAGSAWNVANADFTITEKLEMFDGPHSNYGASGTHTLRLSTIRGAFDNLAGEGGTLTVEDCLIKDSVDDGVTSHSPTATVILRRCTIRDNSTGIQQQFGAVELYDCLLEGDSSLLLQPGTGTTTLAERCIFRGKAGATCHNSGAGTFNYCIFDASLTSNATDLRAFSNGSATSTYNNCLFYGGTGAAKGDLWVSGTGTIDMVNCAFVNWNRTYRDAGTGVINCDHCYVDMTTVSLSTNTNEVTGDPLLSNAPTHWRPDAGSSLLAAGTPVVGLVADYYGEDVDDTNPSIGVSELAV